MKAIKARKTTKSVFFKDIKESDAANEVFAANKRTKPLADSSLKNHMKGFDI